MLYICKILVSPIRSVDRQSFAKFSVSNNMSADCRLTIQTQIVRIDRTDCYIRYLILDRTNFTVQ